MKPMSPHELRGLCCRFGLTQSQLAALLGVGDRTVRSWIANGVSGKDGTGPALRLLRLLALGVVRRTQIVNSTEEN